MDFFLQFGHGMMKMSEHLIDSWGNGTVILSPRDLKYNQMEKTARAIRQKKGNVVIDPQFYLPRSKHKKLNDHSFWPVDYQTALFSPTSINEMLTLLNDEYNEKMDSSFFILPSLVCSSVDEDWNNWQLLILNEINKINIKKEIYATICLKKEVMASEEQIHLVLEYLEEWDVDGVYLVIEPPANSNYLVQDPIWLLNLLDLSSGIKLQKKKVVVGYANHQLLCLASAKVDAIASGNFSNVRSFKQTRFEEPKKDQISRRSTWYYCPQALSEYQVPFLDIAYRQGLITELTTDDSFNSSYAKSLFSGVQPTSSNFGESDSFKHYLHCLRNQVNSLTKPTYEGTKNAVNLQLETAQRLTDFFTANGIRGKNRDFSNVVDDTMSAMVAFDRLRGMRLKHQWNNI
jgi:hypothetical protein